MTVFHSSARFTALVAASIAGSVVLAPLVAVPASATVATLTVAAAGPAATVDEPRAVVAPDAPPALDGVARVGGSVSVATGAWLPDDVALTVAWFADGTRIQDSDVSLVLAPELAGAVLHAEVTGALADEGSVPVTVASETVVVEPGEIVGSAPTVTGAAVVGTTLRADAAWSPGTVTYRWTRDGAPVDGATSPEYTVTAADLGARLAVTVTAQADGYATRVESSAVTAPVTGVLSGALPLVTGVASVGSTLTAQPGSWSVSAALGYQWTRDGVAIDGATARTYVPVPGDLGTQIAVVVTGSAAHHPDLVRTSTAVTIVAGTFSAPAPRISGTAQVGKKVTALSGTWSPTASLAYQWKVDGRAITGATSSSYTLPASVHGRKITVTVTGTADGYATSSVASAAVTVAAGAFSAPAPAVSGTVQVGRRLTASAGTWSPKASLAYQWRANGAAIKGATSSSYTLPASAHGKRITVTVTGRATGYATKSVTSRATATVVKPFSRTATPRITGTAQVGKTLTVSPGTWSPKPSFSYQWKVNGRAVSGATSSTYRVRTADKGKRITVTVTARRSSYVTASRTSAATAAVKAAPRPSRTTPVNNGWDCPSWAPIKGNRSSSGDWIYHVPGGRWYDRTKPEECFGSTAAARAAGYRPSKNG
ncbi:sunset domain-containing protein [Cellulosimicrobium marinum]|uniref:sunset domain-containing protein n=1 Tax=Cellulosimicrobium marinum TaxID=1638992 RepID=UPI001E4044CD|nr:hypothetical protein [Cellulosimicrobium marinum]MCB7137209.1 hypothetical protein [Cellulosimicrobium marinum]